MTALTPPAKMKSYARLAVNNSHKISRQTAKNRPTSVERFRVFRQKILSYLAK